MKAKTILTVIGSIATAIAVLALMGMLFPRWSKSAFMQFIKVVGQVASSILKLTWDLLWTLFLEPIMNLAIYVFGLGAARTSTFTLAPEHQPLVVALIVLALGVLALVSRKFFK